MIIYGSFGKYTGEVGGLDGKAHGEGSFADSYNTQTYKGTFLDGKPNGLCT